MTPPTVREVVSDLERAHPDLWRVCYPRAYADAGAFPSPKYPAACYAQFSLTAAAIGAERMPVAARDGAFVGAMCARHDFPLFFVRQSLVGALALTDLPETITWPDLPLPFPGCTFLLPRKALQHPVDGDVSFLGVARYSAAEEASIPAPGMPRMQIKRGAFFMVAASARGSCWSATLSPDDLPIKTVRLGAGEATTDVSADGESFASRPLIPAEADFVASLLHLSAGLVLALDARPDLLTPGAGSGRFTSGTGRREFWTPNFLGLSYTAPSAPHGESTVYGSSPRLHWRRGHFTRQPYGPARSLRKTLWRDPILVGGKS